MPSLDCDDNMKSILIATDFSEEAEAARHRAASIAKEAGLRGTVVHVLPDSLPPDMHIPSASRAQQALALLEDELGRGGLHFETRLLSGDIAAELAGAAREHDLVVAGARGQDLLLDFALGRTSTRLVRQSGRPTLIVKKPPAEPYRRVVAAVDFSAPSFAAAACAVQIAPRADFNLVNAFEVEFESTLRLAGTEEDRIQVYRREAREKAMSGMEGFLARLALPRGQMRPTLAFGYPPRVILDSAAQGDAQLIVIGKHAAGIVEHLVIGSVALQVLEMAGCDVLVVPEVTS